MLQDRLAPRGNSIAMKTFPAADGQAALALRWPARLSWIATLLALAVLGLLVAREMRLLGVSGAGGSAASGGSPAGIISRPPLSLPVEGQQSVPGSSQDGEPLASATPAPADNASEIDGAPPAPIDVPPHAYLPPLSGPPLAPEHMPQEASRRAVPMAPQDVAAFRSQVEAYLASDPEALQLARAMFDEPDPAVRASNLKTLADSFALQ
jgi:hypothetical protein